MSKGQEKWCRRMEWEWENNRVGSSPGQRGYGCEGSDINSHCKRDGEGTEDCREMVGILDAR